MSLARLTSTYVLCQNSFDVQAKTTRDFHVSGRNCRAVQLQPRIDVDLIHILTTTVATSSTIHSLYISTSSRIPLRIRSCLFISSWERSVRPVWVTYTMRVYCVVCGCLSLRTCNFIILIYTLCNCVCSYVASVFILCLICWD